MVKLVQPGSSVGKFGLFAAALQLGAWGAPGHAASQFLLAAVLCAPMGCDCLALQDCLKSFTVPFLPKQEPVLINKETPTTFPC